MVSNCADLTLSIFLYLTVRSPIWPYNYCLKIALTLTRINFLQRPFRISLSVFRIFAYYQHP